LTELTQINNSKPDMGRDKEHQYWFWIIYWKF